MFSSKAFPMNNSSFHSTFCWTKMGTEAGEDLGTIVRRKEWERQLGGGVFFWGIGQSLGTNALKATEQLGTLDVLFSPMLSRAKSIDRNPNKIVVWSSWIDSSGEINPLPKHVLVTSRATLPSGRAKLNHYALVCRSSVALFREQTFNVHYASLRNLVSDKPLGHSQVTAVVKVDNQAKSNTGRTYPVAFSAKLDSPYFVQLRHPRHLLESEIEEINRISTLGNSQSWEALVQQIRAENYYPEPTRDLYWDSLG